MGVDKTQTQHILDILDRVAAKEGMTSKAQIAEWAQVTRTGMLYWEWYVDDTRPQRGCAISPYRAEYIERKYDRWLNEHSANS